MSDSSFNVDLVQALKDLNNPEKDQVNPFHKNKYVSLASALRAVKEPVANQNLALMQLIQPGIADQHDRLVTRIIHVYGDFIEDGGIPLYMKDHNNPQALGSAISYARRYGLLSILGLVGDEDRIEDDDGNNATPETFLKKEPAKKPAVKKEVVSEDRRRLGTRGNDVIVFVEDHITQFSTHKTMAEHELWNKTFGPEIKQLKDEHPKLFRRMELAWVDRKNELTNRKEQ